MSQTVSVLDCAYKAIFFVVTHPKDCIIRALPYIAVMSVFYLFSRFFGTWFGYLSEIAEPFLYATFAVSWHRYSLLPSSREYKGLRPDFGKREFLFGSLSLAITVLIRVVYENLSVMTRPEVAIILLAFIVPVIALATFLLFPAIALDQPIKPIEFMKTGLNMFKPFMRAFLVLAVVGFLVRGPLEYMIFDDPAYGFTEQAKKDALFLLFDILLGPLLLAVAVSTVTFLYRDLIGFETDKSTKFQ